jgi:hypothetical protein
VTTAAPQPNPLAELPSMPDSAAPVVLPGLLRGLGIRPRAAVPQWITDPDLIASIKAGLVDIPDDFNSSQWERP